MTVGELRQRLERYNEDEIIDMKFLVDNNYYRGYIKDVYKLFVSKSQQKQPVTIELQVDLNLSIRQRFDLLGKAVEDAIDRNSTELTNIAYGGR
jgi:hypothetical protein